MSLESKRMISPTKTKHQTKPSKTLCAACCFSSFSLLVRSVPSLRPSSCKHSFVSLHSVTASSFHWTAFARAAAHDYTPISPPFHLCAGHNKCQLMQSDTRQQNVYTSLSRNEAIYSLDLLLLLLYSLLVSIRLLSPTIIIPHGRALPSHEAHSTTNPITYRTYLTRARS